MSPWSKALSWRKKSWIPFLSLLTSTWKSTWFASTTAKSKRHAVAVAFWYVNFNEPGRRCASDTNLGAPWYDRVNVYRYNHFPEQNRTGDPVITFLLGLTTLISMARATPLNLVFEEPHRGLDLLIAGPPEQSYLAYALRQLCGACRGGGYAGAGPSKQ